MAITISSTHRSVSVLAVSAALDDHSALRAIFSHSAWTLRGVASLKEALRWLERDPVPVVICNRELPDGDWRSLLRKSQSLPRPARVLVAAATPDDRLWEEVGSAGGYDVLEIPFQPRDVFYSVHMAWESWHRQWARASAPATLQTGAGDPNPAA